MFKDGRVEKGSTILIITAFHLSYHEGEGGRWGQLPWLLRVFRVYLFCYCWLYVRRVKFNDLWATSWATFETTATTARTAAATKWRKMRLV